MKRRSRTLKNTSTKKRKRQMKLRTKWLKALVLEWKPAQRRLLGSTLNKPTRLSQRQRLVLMARPTDQQLVEQGKAQLEVARQAKAKQDELIGKIQA